MPTIKELSDALGTSKPTIKRKLQELGLWDGHVNKSGTTFAVDDYASSILASSVSIDAPVDEPKSQDDGGGVVDSLNRYIAALEKQLEAKDAQIAALIEQNAALAMKVDSLGESLSGMSEQIARANVIAERPHGLWERLLGPGRD